MSDGTLPQELTSTNLTTDGNYTAGHGKRKYFTTDLLSQLDDKVTVDASRDRVYFYIDENLTLSDRDATVTLIYKENGTEQSRRTIKLGQVHLLPVEMRDGGIIYMEQYEEYLNHYDPLDNYSSEHLYDGLPWAFENTALDGEIIPQLYRSIGIGTIGSPYESPGAVFNDGWEYSRYGVFLAGEEDITLNGVPKSAFQYCYNKNIRNTNNAVPAEYRHPIIGDAYIQLSNDSKWFLPGIRQMEDALTRYYPIFPEFQTGYYWSSSAGERENATSGQNSERARATKVLPNGGYINSGGGGDGEFGGDTYKYELGRGGYAKRNEELRIRAFRIDLEPYNY